MGFMPGLTITTRVPPDAGTTSPIGSSGPAGDVGVLDADTPQNAPSPTRPPVSPITPTQESARWPGPDGHGDGPIHQQAHRDHHRQQHATFSSSASTSSHSLTPPSTSTNNNGNYDNDNNNKNNNIPIFARGRPTFTHSQQDQVGIPPPPPQPIAFDDNPDVLALKSAITILQLQRQRATADIQALNRAKSAALSDPGAFVADLAAGRIGMDGDPLLNGPGPAGNCTSDDDDEEEEDEDEDGDVDMKSGEDSVDDEEDGAELPSSSESRHDPDGDISVSGAGNTLSTSTPNCDSNNNNNNNDRRKIAQRKDRVSKTTKQPQGLSKIWRSLPKPQTVVRCPPINWAQYAVVGESLDKLHREQLMAPTLGVPAVVSPGGVYEFRGTTAVAGAAPGGGVISGGSGSGNAMGDSAATADRTSTPPTTTMGTMAGTEAQQSPGETWGQGQGQGQGVLPTPGQNQQTQRLVGVAAPYTPGRDKIERTTGRKATKR